MMRKIAVKEAILVRTAHQSEYRCVWHRPVLDV